MQRSPRSLPTAPPRRRPGAASIDYVLVLGVVLPMVAVVMPASRTAVMAAFSWFCRITTSPFL